MKAEIKQAILDEWDEIDPWVQIADVSRDDFADAVIKRLESDTTLTRKGEFVKIETQNGHFTVDVKRTKDGTALGVSCDKERMYVHPLADNAVEIYGIKA